MAPRPRSPQRDRLQALRPSACADVLIIGGGINGLSTFRDLALQGVSVTLVDAKDFCSGASAASSHMVHGGIRYLENGELRLVKESLQERNRLLRNAPHYVRPLPTVIPLFQTFSGLLDAPWKILSHRPGPPKERGALLIKLGLMVYDLFGRAGGTMPRHTFLGRKKSLLAIPGLNPDVKYTAQYYDAAMDNPERLALDVLRDGLAQGSHATAHNYVEATGVDGEAVILTDQLTGETFPFHASVIINTSGPWTDITNRALGVDTHYLGGTKGSHIVVDHPELYAACGGREIFFENKDRRIVLLLPVAGRVLIGTTDIPIKDPGRAECTEEEVDYFIDLVGHVFPDYPLDRSHIVYRYSGVRPLPAAGDLSPGLVSRDYRVVSSHLRSGQPLLSLVGGKWTTFRALGEHLSSEVMKLLGTQPMRSTKNLPIGGGKDFPLGELATDRWVGDHTGAHNPDRVRVLLARYGTIALEFLANEPPNEPPLDSAGGYTRAEIRTLVQRENVVHLVDLVYRRTNLGFTGSITRDGAEELAAIVGSELGWSTAERAEQTASLGKNLPSRPGHPGRGHRVLSRPSQDSS